MMKIKGREYLNTTEAAKFTGIPVARMRSYMRTGQVFKTAKKINGTRYHVLKMELVRFKKGLISVAGCYSMGA